MQKSLREDLALRGYDLVFEYRGSTVAINTKEFTEEKEEAVYQKYGLKTLRWDESIVLYNPEVWRVTNWCSLELIKDCLAPEQVFFTVSPWLKLEGTKNLRHWDLASAKSMRGMFLGCTSLEELVLDGWDVSGVESMRSTFYGCASLKSISLNGWDVSRVKNMNDMFADCKSLKSLCLAGWNVSSVKDFRAMFRRCALLKDLSLNGWCISDGAHTDWMFDNCPVSISVESLIGSSTTPCSVF